VIFIWALFLLSALVVVISGIKLSKYGDFIADRTGAGHFLVGGILMAGATSLPEVATSSTAVLLADAPDIAVGNLFGSNLFNILVLAIIDIYYRSCPFLKTVDIKHILSATVSMLLSSLAAFMIILNFFFKSEPLFFGIAPSSFLIFIVYIAGIRLLYRYQMREQKEQEDILVAEGLSLQRGIIYFSIAAFLIITSGISLIYSAEKIAYYTGVGQTFVGSILVAAITSLPELVAAISALKLGAYDMIVGNIFGSNIFNMSIIFLLDLLYQQGAILNVISLNHLLTALLGIILCIISILGLFYRSEKDILAVGIDSIFILVTYLSGVYLLLQLEIIL